MLIHQDMEIVLDVMPDKADVRVRKEGFESIQDLCLGKLAIDGDIPSFSWVNANSNAYKLSLKRTIVSCLRIKAEEFFLF